MVPALGGSRGGKKYLKQREKNKKETKTTNTWRGEEDNDNGIQGEHIKGSRNEIKRKKGACML